MFEQIAKNAKAFTGFLGNTLGMVPSATIQPAVAEDAPKMSTEEIMAGYNIDQLNKWSEAWNRSNDRGLSIDDRRVARVEANAIQSTSNKHESLGKAAEIMNSVKARAMPSVKPR